MAARSAGILALAASLVAPAAGAQSAGPAVTTAPTVTGTAKAGSRLVAGSGTWTSASAVSYAYQWYRCDAAGAHCASIHGATAPGLTLGRRDVGKTIGLTVTASDGRGSTAAYASLAGPIADAKPLLVSTAQPQLTGLAVEGEPLQVTTGAWSPAPSGFAYSWLRCNPNGRVCAPVAGAGAAAYTLTGADVGHALVAVVDGAFGTTRQSALSTASAIVVGGDLAGPSRSALPVVTGTAERGAQLTGSSGRWTGVGSLSYAYQWYRCDADGAHCSSIHGATAATYRSVASDVGQTLGLGVRATDSTGSATAYSSLFGPIAPARSLAASAAPALAGTASPGSTLIADAGLWQPSVDKLAYRWRRCNANGRICVPIPAATKQSYTVTGADVGHALVAVVTATAGAATQAAYSTVSRVVA